MCYGHSKLSDKGKLYTVTFKFVRPRAQGMV